MVAIDLITKHIQRELTERNLHFRWDLANIPIEDGIPPDVLVLPETNQIKVGLFILFNLVKKSNTLTNIMNIIY